MDVALFNFRSPRAMKARLGQSLAPWAVTLEISVVLFIVGGIALVVLGFSIGWAAIGLAAIPAMVVEWYKYELRDTPIIKGGSRVDDVLDSEVLGIMIDQMTPQQLAMVISKTNGGIFFAVRFGISGSFLEQLVSTQREDTAIIFKEALKITQVVGGRMSAGVLLLAMVRQLPQKDTLLGHLQLNEDDIIRGIKWYHHLRDLIEAGQKKTKKSGGIGRDWSFGWIPTLSRFGQNLSELSVRPTQMRHETMQQIMKTIGGGRGAIALVGQIGVGKTQMVYELASALMTTSPDVPDRIRYHQLFMLDAGRLISTASGRGELEGLIQTLLAEAYIAKNIIICLDNAQLFFEEGVGSVDLTNMLLPILEAGRLPIILTIDEQKFLQISKRTPTLATAINRINIHPTSESDTLKVLEEQLPAIEFKRKVTYMYQALKEAHKLSARYVYDVAMPGQAMSLLDAAADYAESGLVTAKSVNLAIEKTIGVKTNVVDDDSERETLLNLESLIHQRMIGQERAVRVVSDALRRARAGVRNQKRPVGTFMFLGPTGVGKTELAKSLAAVYFGGEANIIRLDMNEFVSSNDVSRLIADGTEDAGSLTAQVMKQPFSVVLLDEIEKAHSSVLATLLQLLDEGILRDARNRQVSFRDTIVIATSNAGSDRIQEYLHRGYDLEQFEDTFVDELISGNLFHPEFLNRFDEIVVFGPLSKPELLQVVDLILVDINKNMAEQKVTVTVAQAAKEYLVEAGYDPRLGARPMPRVVQRSVENTVAKLLLAREVRPGGTIEISLDQVKSILDKKQQAAEILNK
ncbi:ATP-dependent Clp protease ATP-binding subunit [Candidatus Saccharibacteria bacterium]|nr:ATP-dependent Clp protease ATP-binding subunit [Candidatus Saccharibacteria bacterium]